jgi:hypothetical protein
MDFGSLVYPGEDGVDNALYAWLSPPFGGLGTGEDMRLALLNARLAAVLYTGVVLLVVRLTELDSFSDDSSVGVEVGFADPVACGGRGPCFPQFDESDGLLAGQELVFRGEVVETVGAIVGGRLHVAVERVPWPIIGPLLPAAQSDVLVLDAAITPERLHSGVAGGSIAVDEVVRTLHPSPDEAALVHGDYSRLADLDPEEGGALCTRISFGVRFGAVRAEMTEARMP